VNAAYATALRASLTLARQLPKPIGQVIGVLGAHSSVFRQDEAFSFCVRPAIRIVVDSGPTPQPASLRISINL